MNFEIVKYSGSSPEYMLFLINTAENVIKLAWECRDEGHRDFVYADMSEMILISDTIKIAKGIICKGAIYIPGFTSKSASSNSHDLSAAVERLSLYPRGYHCETAPCNINRMDECQQ